MSPIWVLHNPLSGQPDSAAKVDRAVEALARRGVAVRLERRATIDELRGVAREAIAAEAEAVLIAGGDGSVNAMAAELAGSPVALGVLPSGTANVWAKEIGLAALRWHRPDALERAALSLLEGQTRLADLGRCNGHLFLLWVGTGLDAFVVERLAPRRWHTRRFGLLYNTLATFFIARQWRGADMRVVAGGREIAGHYLLVIVANVNQYGGGVFNLGHNARLDDGQLDVWLFGGSTYAEAMAHSGRLFLGRHASHPQVTHLAAERVDIYPARPQAIQIDGELLLPAQHIAVQVIPASLRVLVPSGAERKLFSPPVLDSLA